MELSKTLFKSDGFKNARFLFKCGQKTFLKMEILENDDNTIIIEFILVRESNSRREFNST